MSVLELLSKTWNSFSFINEKNNPSFIHTTKKFLNVLYDEVSKINILKFNELKINLFNMHNDSSTNLNIILFTILFPLFACISLYLSRNSTKESRFKLFISSIFSVLCIMTPLLIPYKAMRFVLGLITFATNMVLLSKISSKLQQEKKTIRFEGENIIDDINDINDIVKIQTNQNHNALIRQTRSKTNTKIISKEEVEIKSKDLILKLSKEKESEDIDNQEQITANENKDMEYEVDNDLINNDATNDCWLSTDEVIYNTTSETTYKKILNQSFFNEILDIFNFNLRGKIQSIPATKIQTSKLTLLKNFCFSILNCIYLFLMIDSTTYLLKEFIPDLQQNIENIDPYNTIKIIILESVIGGLWILYAVSWNYNIYRILLTAFGKDLPLKLQHHSPLLSTSLAEFWGIRWNPVISKLLQDAFYKPLRKIGVSRTYSMLSCFVGSALLHAIPQYLSTYNFKDSLMIGSFFIVHAILILFEQSLVKIIQYGLNTWTSWTVTFGQNTSLFDQLKLAEYQWLAEFFVVNCILGER